MALQGYLAHKKLPPPRTLQEAHTQGPAVVLLGGAVSCGRSTPVGTQKGHYGQNPSKGELINYKTSITASYYNLWFDSPWTMPLGT